MFLVSFTCSGLMYISVPIIAPVLVKEMLSFTLAMPKSSSLMLPRLSRKRFDGLMSRCTISMAWV